MRRTAGQTGRKKPRFAFFREAIVELRKVVWPPRREATRLTMIVIIVSVAMGLFLGLSDYGFSKLVEVILPGP